MFKISVLAILLLFSFVSAQSIEECMECHSDDELTKFVDDTVEVSLYVDIEAYTNSIHGDMECVDCHSDIEDVDHGEDLAEVACGDCHDGAQEEFIGSIHAPTEKETHGLTVGCTGCHGKHNILASDDENSMTYQLNIEKTCGNCHSKPEVIQILGLSGMGPAVAYHNSVHDRVLNQDPERGAPTCIRCHGTHNIYLMTDPRSSFNKLNRAELCGECHEKEKNEYLESIHWNAVSHGHFESPTCNDCHGEHNIQRPSDEESATYRLNASQKVCENCHASPVMMERFGLDVARFESYSRTYHGMASLSGSKDAPTCISCHETHAIHAQWCPESSVHPDNLEQTCSKCHDEITAEFISIPAHPINLESRNPIAHYAKLIYVWLIIVTIGGMLVHNIIILRHYIVAKRHALKGERTIQRFQPFEVYQHMLLFLSFFILVITGFALKFPGSFWVEWLTNAGLDEALRSLIHRIAAVVLVIISLIQTAYFIANRKGRKEIAALMPKVNDVTGFIANMKYHLGLSKQKPRFGRWDYTEKAEYLALIWGTAVMAITGFVLWFPEFFMSFLPSWIFETSEIIHYYEAWLATLAIIVWHWFFVIYHPERYPMSLTWMNGKITEEEMKHHHPLEYEELNQTRDPRFEHPDGITTIRDQH